VLDDTEAQGRPAQVRRVVLCSGKVAVDLLTSELRAQSPEVAIVRVEQLYPFPWEDLKPVLARFPKLDEVVWLQEEPENMGAWEFVRPLLEEAFEGRWPLRYVGRARSASPSEGSMAWHAANQRMLIAEAFQPSAAKGRKKMVLSKKV
jgi:2-oxoglutarate dehydrogenase E1 component